MGNNKFKLSDMIPNAWFYKLKHMTTTKSTTTKRRNDKTNNNNTKNYINQHHHHRQTLASKKKPPLSPITAAKTVNSDHGKNLAAADPPRRSSKRRSTSSSSPSSRRRNMPAFKPRSRLISNSSSADTFSSESDSLFAASDEDNPTLRLRSSTTDIIIDLETRHHHRELPPILTKQVNFDDSVFEAAAELKKSNNLSVKTAKTLERSARSSQNGRRSTSSSSPGIKLRSNSPRLACARKSVSCSRRYLSESLAVVKSSVDPQRDFTESMVEMIVENNIRASKDLEELLACYLSLNSKQYHDVIVKAFERIWFDMARTRVQ